jgi:hypothetical protein
MRRAPIRARRATPRRRTAPQEGADWWEEATALMLVRCRHLCERCNRPLMGRMERHHRTRRRDGGDRLSNLLALHPGCHTYITEHPEEAKANGWIVPALSDAPPTTVPVRIVGAWWLLRDDGGKTPVP